MNVWNLTNWKENPVIKRSVRKSGLKLIFDKNINIEVRRACKEFCQWLEIEYTFPTKIPIYVKGQATIKALDGEQVSATFFYPYGLNGQPFIRVATGDYQTLVKRRGKDNALASILTSIAHELTHYFQWLNGLALKPRKEERQAYKCARYIVQTYAEIREHP